MVIMQRGATDEQVQTVIDRIQGYGMEVHVSRGSERTLIGIIGDERDVDFGSLEALPGVERAMPVLKPFKYVSKDAHPEGRVIDVDGIKIGQDLVFMAGPCSVEDEDTTLRVADAVAKAGAQMFRGGAYKPRTSAWSFQGLREKGLKILSKAKAATGLPIVTEIVDAEDIELVGEHTDIYQVGMRNMRHYSLLSKLGETDKPVLLKRGDSAKLTEWLAAAEYIVRNGNEKVILCERGIRTFEDYTRNTLDLNAIVGAKIESCLPVCVDPSHGTGLRSMVPAMAAAGVASGADAVMIEVHCDPDQAWSDGRQTVAPDVLTDTIDRCNRVREAMQA
jgi:3-deoxy-7-phosphoheptulonate synthase